MYFTYWIKNVKSDFYYFLEILWAFVYVENMFKEFINFGFLYKRRHHLWLSKNIYMAAHLNRYSKYCVKIFILFYLLLINVAKIRSVLKVIFDMRNHKFYIYKGGIEKI